jgi:hypothetical protein
MLRSKNLSILTSILITLHGVLALEDAVSIATSVAGGEPATLNLGGGITSSSNGEATETAIVAASSTTTGNGEAVITTAPAGDLSTVSIDAAPGYQIAGSCVKDCLFGELEGEPDGLMLPLELGCYRSLPFPPKSIPHSRQKG